MSSRISFLVLAGIFLLAASSTAVYGKDFQCEETIKNTDDSGSLVIKPAKDCFFKFITDSSKVRIVNVKIDNLAALSGASLVVDRLEKEQPALYNFSSPFNPGYIRLTGVSESRITFRVPNETTLEFSADVEKLDLPCSSAKEFDLLLTNHQEKTSFNCIETVPFMSHIELARATFQESALHHRLVSSDFSIQPLDNRVILKIAPASPKCSQDHIDQSNSMLLAPVRETTLENLVCVNTFTLTNSQTHFDLNFQNLTNALAPQDSITVDLGEPSSELLINKASESLFTDKVYSSVGKQMAIVYHSVNEPTNKFNLSVLSRGAGGVVQVTDASLTTLNLAGAQDLVRFTLKPSSSNSYSLLQFPANIRLTDSNVTISDGDKIIAYFENSYLPGTVTSNEPGQTLILQMAGKSFKQLEGTKVGSVKSSCSKLSYETGNYSIAEVASDCLWTVTSSNGIGFKVNSNDLKSNSCLSIQSLDFESSNSLIYNKCNVTSLYTLPTFTFKRAVVKITLTQGARFDAVLLNRPDSSIIKSAQSPPFNLTSHGYPLDYAVSSSNKSHTFITGKQEYVVSVVDLDLREGEKMTLNGTGVSEISSGIDVVIPKNTTSQLTVSRPTKAGSTILDSSTRRGFKLAVSTFDYALRSSDQKSANVSIPANLTSVYLTLSTEPGKKFNFTMSKIANVDVDIFDAKSIYGQKIKINGSSTSNNVILTFKSRKDFTIPHLFVNYTVIPCNLTAEHQCDSKTRCIPYVNLCKGIQFCDDGSDILAPCNSSATIVKVIESGMSGISIFFLCMVMIAIGVCCTMYGPNVYKIVDDRFRGGQYSSFTSSE